MASASRAHVTALGILVSIILTRKSCRRYLEEKLKDEFAGKKVGATPPPPPAPRCSSITPNHRCLFTQISFLWLQDGRDGRKGFRDRTLYLPQNRASLQPHQLRNLTMVHTRFTESIPLFTWFTLTLPQPLTPSPSTSSQILHHAQVLELGAGRGTLSVGMARLGAHVTSTEAPCQRPGSPVSIIIIIIILFITHIIILPSYLPPSPIPPITPSYPLFPPPSHFLDTLFPAITRHIR
jgi:hypothetical protein